MNPGIRLKCELVRRGLRQYQLASKLGVCPTTLNRQLNGKARIDKDDIAKIKKAIKWFAGKR
jgi:plasmid maintenance system antidote protein VapI